MPPLPAEQRVLSLEEAEALVAKVVERSQRTEEPPGVAADGGQECSEPDTAGAAGRHGVDELLIAALAQGKTRSAAAQAANVSERTVYRRLADTEFVAKVASARTEQVDLTTRRLEAAGFAAAETLVDLLDPRESPSVRLAAARSVLDHGRAYRATQEVETRLADLERRVADGSATRWR